jgi:hypothetical protein
MNAQKLIQLYRPDFRQEAAQLFIDRGCALNWLEAGFVYVAAQECPYLERVPRALRPRFRTRLKHAVKKLVDRYARGA